MLVLALDTTTPGGSAAIARAGTVLREEPGDGSRPPAAQLPDRLMGLLDRTGVSVSEVDAYAVATGPGSFTGLRVGIATMQGLAFARRKPLVGISSFDALARVARRSTGRDWGGAGRVATWVDAWRGDVYAALYDHEGLLEAPVVAEPGELLLRMRGVPTLFVGDGARTYATLIHDVLGDSARISQPAAPLLAGEIASLATVEVGAGRRPTPHAIRPLYVRRSDAERARDARRAP